MSDRRSDVEPDNNRWGAGRGRSPEPGPTNPPPLPGLQPTIHPTTSPSLPHSHIQPPHCHGTPKLSNTPAHQQPALSTTTLPSRTAPTTGLFFGHNMPHSVEVLDYGLPSPVPNWPELDGDVIGFRPAEAVSVAAAWFPASDGLAEVEAPADHGRYVTLGDGRAIDVTSGELVRLVPTVETHPLRAVHERKIIRRLVIAGGKIAIECDHLDRTEKRLEAIEAALALDAMLDDLGGEWDATPTTGCTEGALMSSEDEDEGYGRVIWEFSRKSRQRLRQRVAEADWYAALQIPGVRIGMITLTYPGDWERYAPNPDAITAHRHALEKRLTRALGYLPGFFWVREFQGRGAPHFHLAGAWPTTIEGLPLRTWLSRTWYDIVGSVDPRHLNAGTRIDWAKGLDASDPNRLAAYFSAYSTGEGGKEYQHHPPEGWCNENGSAGRHWGYRGVDLTRAEVTLTRDQMIEAQRFLRRYIASQKRTMRTKGRTGDRPRAINRRWKLSSLVGLDSGFTFLTNDGPALAVALARAIHQPDQEETPWPPSQTRPLP